ncbi:hypothetical protein PRZ48_009519 [Zasmidium cellare]|uniref:Zn(2)-C6 fungal-type domain-containing protein n=1 Tax=Zasmidium cellare TaxID=395010 RepID=A0ABR0EBY8_ZASCE|nr:hypothetical protein PRZ48_009519 [Zasmidium cellare]
MADDKPPRGDIPYPSDKEASGLQRTYDLLKDQHEDVQAPTKRSIDEFNIRRYVWRMYNPGWKNPLQRPEPGWKLKVPTGFDAKIHLIYGALPAAPPQPDQHPPKNLPLRTTTQDDEPLRSNGAPPHSGQRQSEHPPPASISRDNEQPHRKEACRQPDPSQPKVPPPPATSRDDNSARSDETPTEPQGLLDTARLDLQLKGKLLLSAAFRGKRTQPVSVEQQSWPCFEKLTAENKKIYDEYASEGLGQREEQTFDERSADEDTTMTLPKDLLTPLQPATTFNDSFACNESFHFESKHGSDDQLDLQMEPQANEALPVLPLPYHKSLAIVDGHDDSPSRRDSQQIYDTRPLDLLSTFPLDGTPAEKRTWFEEHDVHVRCTPCQVRGLKCDHDVTHPDGGCSDCRATGAQCDVVRPRGPHTEDNCKYKPTCYHWHDYARVLAKRLAQHFGYDYQEPQQHRFLDANPPLHPKRREDGSFRQMNHMDMMPAGFLLPASAHNLSGVKPNTLARPWMYKRWDPPFYEANRRQIEQYDGSLRAAEWNGLSPPLAEATTPPDYRSAESVQSVPHQVLRKSRATATAQPTPLAQIQHNPSFVTSKRQRASAHPHWGIDRRSSFFAPAPPPKVTKEDLSQVIEQALTERQRRERLQDRERDLNRR